jgi:hypothetical protein
MVVRLCQRSAILNLSDFPALLQRSTAGFLLFCLLITSAFPRTYLDDNGKNVPVRDRSVFVQVLCTSALPISIVDAIFTQNCGAQKKEKPKQQKKNNSASLDYAICFSGNQVHCERDTMDGGRVTVPIVHAFAGPDVAPALVKLKEGNAPPGSAAAATGRLLFLLLPRSDVGEHAVALSGERDQYAQLGTSSWVFLLEREL